MRKLNAVLAATLLLAVGLTGSPADGAKKKTIVVTSFFDDVPDGCQKNDCTLREAIIQSNRTKKVTETIRLGPGDFDLTIAGAEEEDAATGDLDITRPVKIVGVPTATRIRQLAVPDDRVIHVRGGGKLTLTGVELSDGNTFGSGGGILAEAGRRVSLVNSVLSDNTAGFNGLGGGISTAGPLTMVNSVVRDNTSGGGAGGVASDDATVTISRSTVVNNKTLSHNGVGGGGVYFDGPGRLTIADTTIDGNTAASNGGGVLAFGPRLDATILRSTISNNDATGSGGGIMTFEGFTRPSQTRIVDSTISGNEADSTGGGLYCSCPASPSEGDPYSTITRSTITDNTADSDNTNEVPTGGEGGGLAGGGQKMDVLATILGGNHDPGDAGDEDCGGFEAQSLGSNVTTENPLSLTNSGCFNQFDPVPSDTIVGTLDFLGPLQDNGGPTPTHAIFETATAQDRHVGAGCSGTDQRGVVRPVGAGCDSGAYEYVECNNKTVNVVGTTGKDVITGTNGPDVILAQGGNDTVFGGLGNDTVCGGNGNDKLSGQDDADDLFGERGDDRVDGGTNVDTCDGGPGKDKLLNCE